MKKRTKRILIIAAAAALAIGIGYGLLEIGLRPNILAQGEVLLKNKAIEIMNKAVSKTMEGMTDAGDLIQIEKDADGKISMISADSIRMNRIATESALSAQELIEKLGEEELSIPLGNAMNSQLFNGMGPLILIRVTPVGAVGSDFRTEIEAAGINQVRYKAYIVLNAQMDIMVGTSRQNVQVSNEVLVSDVILVGAVPEMYADLGNTKSFLNLLP